MSMVLRVFAMATLFALGVGCGNPCEEFAEIACQTAGEQSQECEKARKRADNASSQNQEQCHVAVELVKSLERVR